ncbi:MULTISPECIES: arginase family protein [unclassified Ensifer]|uniref:arginase family protein n=1 Tax=unclassified Ensifer TaxID=2633371 RepID=UPI000813B8ED|nr:MULTISPECIES: arginase family protein [unclassified Ensifer]OCP01800.1 arginase [Ensifer sp. LC14]OCP09589.1 arginase [Ensifer sp. LC13]OCP10761.1 arginase [Ensifer sp. LC11]OCP32836.1 arginase [Ensifer sp. LC499]
MPIALTCFQGRAGDHNDLAIPGAKSVASHLAQRLGLETVVIGEPEPALNGHWTVELETAMPALQRMRDRLDTIYAGGSFSLAATSRCAVSLATLPAVARHHNDAVVVWFDAHGDLNTPEVSSTGYLGGLALSGPCGLWQSGLGDGLSIGNVVLVGQRDLDPFETDLIKTRRIPHIRPGSDLPQRLAEAVAGRPVYIHLDCDALTPGIVPTDYQHEDGLSLNDLRAACAVLARGAVVGLEIAEFQNAWSEGGEPVSPEPLIEALEPLLQKLHR